MPWLFSGSRPYSWNIIHLYSSQQHPFYGNRLTELNLREVFQMVMLTVVSYMKYLIYSGLNKISTFTQGFEGCETMPTERVSRIPYRTIARLLHPISGYPVPS